MVLTACALRLARVASSRWEGAHAAPVGRTRRDALPLSEWRGRRHVRQRPPPPRLAHAPSFCMAWGMGSGRAGPDHSGQIAAAALDGWDCSDRLTPAWPVSRAALPTAPGRRGAMAPPARPAAQAPPLRPRPRHEAVQRRRPASGYGRLDGEGHPQRDDMGRQSRQPACRPCSAPPISTRSHGAACGRSAVWSSMTAGDIPGERRFLRARLGGSPEARPRRYNLPVSRHDCSAGAE